MASASAKGKEREHRPTVDEDDDDMDELDDVLDQFSQQPSAALSGQASKVPSSVHDALDTAPSPGSTAKNTSDPDGEEDEEDFEALFAQELAKEMEKMLGGLKPSPDDLDKSAGNNPAGTSGTTANAKESEEEKAFRETFERILKQSTEGNEGDDGELDLAELSKLMSGIGGSNAPPANASPSSSSTKAAPPAAGATFQDTISSMQSKLRSSEASHKPPSSADANGDPFAALMAQMEALGAGPGDFGAEGEEGLPGMLDGLMDQLMSRELLEEPIMELRTKYPEYLATAEARDLPAEERRRFEQQSEIVNTIARTFEDPKYSDTDKEMRKKISGLMQKMQDCGAPPKHLLGDLGPAMGLNQDGTPNVDPENCIIS